MHLSPEKFREKYDSRDLKLAFIGMSNIGKSYTAKRLAGAYDFHLIDIDQHIQDIMGHASMDEFARWQGHPYEPGYAEREAKSIAIESDVTLTAAQTAEGNSILDTPGSVIYTRPDVLKTIRETFLVVHIKAVDQDIERLKTDYFERPKPLVWAGHYHKNPEKTDRENIFESYPKLLASRAEKYADLADVTLTSDFIIKSDVTPQDIFQALSGGID